MSICKNKYGRASTVVSITRHLDVLNLLSCIPIYLVILSKLSDARAHSGNLRVEILWRCAAIVMTSDQSEACYCCKDDHDLFLSFS